MIVHCPNGVVIVAKNERFEIPLTGAIAGDDSFRIANPGLRSFDDDRRIRPVDRLEGPIMLRIGRLSAAATSTPPRMDD